MYVWLWMFVVFFRTFVNGASKQDSNTADMIFNCREIIEWLSTDTTLLPGTVILTGTVSDSAQFSVSVRPVCPAARLPV